MAKSVVYNQDCLEAMRAMSDKAFDLAIVDPPYGIGFQYGVYQDTIENLDHIISEILPEVLRVSQRSIWFCSHQRITRFPEPLWVLSYSWDTTGVYGKAGICQWQPILLYGSDVSGFGSVNGVIKSDRIHFTGGSEVGFMRKETINHPCPKPKNIIKHLIKRFALEGNSIIDPFLGSGTSRIAAYDLGFDFTGYELDKDYFEAQEQRFANHIAQPKLWEPASVPVKQNAMFAEAA